MTDERVDATSVFNRGRLNNTFNMRKSKVNLTLARIAVMGGAQL